MTFVSTVNGPKALTVNTAGSSTFSGIVGGSSALASLTTDLAGTTALNGGSVTTSGTQTYSDPVSLGAITTVTSGTTAFANTLNGAFALTVNTSGATTFSAAVGATTPLTSLITDLAGTTALNGGAVTTSGAQTYNDPVTVGALTTVTSATTTFSSTVNGGFGLAVNTSGVTTFGGAVGGTTALASLTTDGPGSTAVNGGAVTTSGAQTYNDPVTIGGLDLVAASTGSANVSFASTVNGPKALTVNTAGSTNLNAAVGATTALASLTTDAPGSTAVNGLVVTTSGAQTYNDPVTLGNNAVLTDTTVSFANVVDAVDATSSHYNLTLSSSAPITLVLGNLGTTNNLGTFVENAGSTVTVSGTLTTTGTQTWSDAVILGGPTTLRSTGVGAAGNITLSSTLDGTQTFAADTVGTLQVTGAVGTTTLGAVTLSNMAAATFSNTVKAASVSFTGTALTANQGWTITGAVGITNSGLFTMAAANAAPFNVGSFAQNNSGGTGTSSLGSNLTSAGTVSFANAVGLTGPVIVATTNATVGFAAAITGAQSLTVNAGTASTTFSQAVGTVGTLLTSLTTDAGGTTFLNGGAVFAVTQTYNDALSLGADLTVTGTTSNFNNTVNGAVNLTVNSSGASVFAAAVGGTTALTSLTTSASGSTALNGASVTTTGAQTYNDAVTIGTNDLVATSSGSGAVTFVSTVNGPKALTVNTAGATTFSGSVGATTALASLTTNAAGSTVLNAAGFTTATPNGFFAFNDPVVLTADAALTSGAAATDTVTFAQTLNGAHNLTIASGTGPVTFTGAVGGTTPLTSLTITGTAATPVNVNGTSITTTNNQAYGRTVAIGGSLTTLTSTTGTISHSAGTLTVGAGGLIVVGNFTGTGGTLTRNASSTLTFTTSGSAAAAVTLGTFTPSVGTDVLFTGAGATTLNSNGQKFDSVQLNGTGSLILGSALEVLGNFTQGAGAGALSDAGVARNFLINGNLTLTSASIPQSSVILVPTGARTVDATGITFHHLILVANGGSLVQATDLTAQNLAVFKGTWNNGGKNLTLTGDLVVYGTKYQSYTINGVTYDPNDDGELAQTRTGPGWTYAGRLGYPYFGSQLPTVAAMNAALAAFTGSPNFLNAAATPNTPAAGLMTGSLSFTGAAPVLSVAGNFYNYGATLTGANPVTLTLSSAHWTSKSPVPLPSTLTAPPTYTPATDWFGRPFAVAITTASGAVINNLAASRPIAAAMTSVAAFTSTGTNTNWDFTATTVTSASTRFDNLVEVVFNHSLQNAQGEVSGDAGPFNHATAGQEIDNFRFSGGTRIADSAWDFTAGTAGVAGEYGTVAMATGDKTTLSFQMLSPNTWNTDATGTSLGAGAASTDRAGTHQTLTPDLTLEKGLFYSTTGNPVINYDAANYNGATLSARYTATTDRARPVLLAVSASQAAKAFPPATPQDGHNGYNATWSEPVTLDATSLTGSTIASGASNVRSANGFGDSYTTDGTTVQVTGMFTYPGTLYRSTRSWGAANAGADPTATQNDATNAKSGNSVFRATSYDATVYVSGYSTGTGTSEYWDGFWYDATNPNGKTFSVPPAFAGNVTDSAGNPVEDSNIVWNYPFAIPADPKVDLKVTQVGQGWELEAPQFAPYTLTPGSYEVVPKANSSPDKIDEVQFHILSNTLHSLQIWDSAASPDNTNTVHFGVRDSSLTQFHVGFRLRTTTESTFDGSHNLQLDNVPPYVDNTAVSNDLFNGGPPPLAGFSTGNDGYFTLKLSGVSANWKPTVNYRFFYDRYQGMATNLTGQLLGSTPSDGYLAIDRTPPYLALTLTGKDMDRIYAQFSRQVKVTDPLGSGNFENVLKLTGSSNSSNKITKMEFLDGDSNLFQQAFLYLQKPFDPSDFISSRLAAVDLGSGVSSVVSGTNNMDTTVNYPVSFLGLNIAEPIWASDGKGGELNQTATAHVIHDFTGAEPLTSRDIELQAKVYGGDKTPLLNQLPLRMYYDLNVPSGLVANNLWLPTGLYSSLPGLVPSQANGETRYLDPASQSSNGSLKNYLVPGNDPELLNGSSLEFIFRLGSLYIVHGTNNSDPRELSVWKAPLKAIKTQKNGMTILNNVIDPTKGQQTQVFYTMAKSGVITVQVFALDGSLVRVLQSGRQAPGDYSVYWDGKNSTGEVVARGVYFIRVIAPSIDETRNVLVIK